MSVPRTPVIESLSEIADRYDVLYCDLWGCLHNGVAPYPAAVAALRAFRARGGVVALLTNAPRPSDSVAAHLAEMGTPADVSDLIVSSGDAARAAVAAGGWGRRVHHIGPDRDSAFFDGLPVERVALDDAESVICTGLRDDTTETPDDYAGELREAQLRRLPMLNANPDIMVHRGDQAVFCAGAIARGYQAIGGRVTTCGKPHAPIYDHAARKVEDLLGREADPSRILAIGDGIATDIAGAVSEGLDSLFVTGGLAADRMGADPEAPDGDLLAAFVREARLSPTWAIGRLR